MHGLVCANPLLDFNIQSGLPRIGKQLSGRAAGAGSKLRHVSEAREERLSERGDPQSSGAQARAASSATHPRGPPHPRSCSIPPAEADPVSLNDLSFGEGPEKDLF